MGIAPSFPAEFSSFESATTEVSGKLLRVLKPAPRWLIDQYAWTAIALDLIKQHSIEDIADDRASELSPAEIRAFMLVVADTPDYLDPKKTPDTDLAEDLEGAFQQESKGSSSTRVFKINYSTQQFPILRDKSGGIVKLLIEDAEGHGMLMATDEERSPLGFSPSFTHNLVGMALTLDYTALISAGLLGGSPYRDPRRQHPEVVGRWHWRTALDVWAYTIRKKKEWTVATSDQFLADLRTQVSPDFERDVTKRYTEIKTQRGRWQGLLDWSMGIAGAVSTIAATKHFIPPKYMPAAVIAGREFFNEVSSAIMDSIICPDLPIYTYEQASDRLPMSPFSRLPMSSWDDHPRRLELSETVCLRASCKVQVVIGAVCVMTCVVYMMGPERRAIALDWLYRYGRQLGGALYREILAFGRAAAYVFVVMLLMAAAGWVLLSVLRGGESVESGKSAASFIRTTLLRPSPQQSDLKVLVDAAGGEEALAGTFHELGIDNLPEFLEGKVMPILRSSARGRWS